MAKQTQTNISLPGTFLALAIVLIMSSCGGGQQQAPQFGPTDVDFITLATGEASVEKKYPGAIEGTVNVDIKAQVSGYLDQIYVKEGDYVQKGQSLFRIKGDVFNEQVHNSEAALKAAIASQANAQLEIEKVKPLVEGKVMSEMQLKTAQANYDAATAQVAQAKAALGSSQINAAFSLIKAPVSGYIGRIPNRVGNLVTPADAMPLTSLSEINQVFVYFSLSEADYISFVKDRKTDKGMNTVSLIMADGSVYDHKGTVEIASGNIERTTGSIPLKAIFPNPDKLLRSGGSAKVVMTRTLDSALTIPMGSVKDIQDRFFVFTLADSNKVAMTPIEIAGHSGNNYIVKSGLKAGDKVALNRIDVLNEGMPVVPNTPAATPAIDSTAKAK
ncbi:MAG: efflux RND transporter periplasmic adaptor subunit [Chitinophagaceae bacterium]|nr:efflux RND transporter periplasmic adaptor subunit [Chitinophagaceae bacterium]